MKIKIHKGTDEIGGSCIELSTSNTTIFLDYGTPLKEDSRQVKIDQYIDAILISHPHQDHYGEIVNIDTEIPIYCGELSLELMNATKVFTSGAILKNNFHIFTAWKIFEIGDFKIMPYLVDHSATDAYAFLIEAEGHTLFYSGDFRANGRKAKLFEKILDDEKLQGVDVLLMEGTMLHRSNDGFPDEQSVEEKIYQTIGLNHEASFIIGSSQNIDTMVSAYRACKRAGKILVVDIYTAWILEKINIVSSNVPDISWQDVKVLRPQKGMGTGYMRILNSHRDYFDGFAFKVFHRDNIITADEIAADPSNYLIKSSPFIIENILRKMACPTANILYSQWLGYLNEPYSDMRMVELYRRLQKKYNFVYAHTSGHADLNALKQFASAIKPKKLIPIHTAYKKEFEDHFANVAIMSDNESFDVNCDGITLYKAS